MSEYWIPIAFFAMLATVVPVVSVFKYLRTIAEHRHQERMREIEMGVSRRTPSIWPGFVCLAVGGVVPVTALVFGWITSLVLGESSQELVKDVWKVVGMVGLGGVVCGTILASKLLMCSVASSTVDESAKKPAFDADAFDIADRRG